MQPCDALFLGPHPDDVEIAAGGTVLRLVAAGRRVAVVDVTGGEMGSRGTPADRAREAADAARALGIAERHNLGLPDTGVTDGDAAVQQLVAVLRAARPQLLFAPTVQDVHPDHSATARLAQKAWFLAGLGRYAPAAGGDTPFRPRLLVQYPGNVPVEPTFVVDISACRQQKDAVIRCYRSQLVRPDDRAHLVQARDICERARVRDEFFGARIGVAAAEPFVIDGPLPVADPTLLFA
ncbi:MAG: bacillithiol biosynthesis deacetylase BshB1 [Planctomycetota bacterium]